MASDAVTPVTRLATKDARAYAGVARFQVALAGGRPGVSRPGAALTRGSSDGFHVGSGLGKGGGLVAVAGRVVAAGPLAAPVLCGSGARAVSLAMNLATPSPVEQAVGPDHGRADRPRLLAYAPSAARPLTPPGAEPAACPGRTASAAVSSTPR
jgi:hypothetical protein